VLAGDLLRQRGLHPLAQKVFADRDELHLRRDGAAPRVVHLRYIRPRLCAPRLAMEVEAQAGELRIGEPRPAIGGTEAIELDAVAALGDPLGPQRRKTFANVDRRGRIGVRA
jgi:hypothetical protein